VVCQSRVPIYQSKVSVFVCLQGLLIECFILCGYITEENHSILLTFKATKISARFCALIRSTLLFRILAVTSAEPDNISEKDLKKHCSDG
jgi:hypothetical protein